MCTDMGTDMCPLADMCHLADTCHLADICHLVFAQSLLPEPRGVARCGAVQRGANCGAARRGMAWHTLRSSTISTLVYGPAVMATTFNVVVWWSAVTVAVAVRAHLR